MTTPAEKAIDNLNTIYAKNPHAFIELASANGFTGGADELYLSLLLKLLAIAR